ncbi:arabinan endo-1,5-alpha-L-arabinosidase C [Planoprotostelium fungivorum]|uniref:Arabinan endo-1,5-alpha-L-arabinosidase C n=1 Tax=Planoprotostelium fungivorum TaxID=1890364 RepID=A0A2P6N6R9_9EUKA|nr:arabinan endo-1,5-alpha-L-arabinosidase C [Planoprotostelium fungivorum]
MPGKLLLLFLTTFVLAQGYPKPRSCTGSCSNVQDTNILKSNNGTYYRYTHPIDTTGKDLYGCQIATSPTLDGPWTAHGAMFDGKCPSAGLPSYGQVKLWTPEKRTWYRSNMGVASSNTGLDGTDFIDRGSIGVIENYPTWNRIDPNLLGSYGCGIFSIKMANPPLSVAPKAQAVQVPSELKEEYRVQVCRAESAIGPYYNEEGQTCMEHPGKMVLASFDNIYAPGGASVLEDDVHGAVLYYQYMNTDIGYGESMIHFGWNYLNFIYGWPVLTETRDGIELSDRPGYDLPDQPVQANSTEDCQKMCVVETKYNAWAFDTCGSCWLKNGSPNVVFGGQCRASGVVTRDNSKIHIE